MKKKILKLVSSLIITFAICFIPCSTAFAIGNPDNIAFGTGSTPLYKVFENVAESGDMLFIAEGDVYYDSNNFEKLTPDGAGIDTNLTPSAGANWQCVNDNNDATYVATNTSSYIRDTYTLEDTAVISGDTITSVTLYFRIMSAISGTTYGVPVFYINGNYYNGTYQTATTGWSTKYEKFTTNPSSGSAWTINDLNNMQVGIELLTSNTASQARCSEVYAVVNYVSLLPGGYSASAAFLFELLNTSGNTTIISTPLKDYGDRPISIYITAAQKTSLNITSGTPYILRISGNPLLFSSMTGNSVDVTLSSGDYIDQSSGADSDTPTDNNLRNFCILIALNMQAHDTPISDYYESIQGYTYLTNTGADLFIEGVPNLYNFCPILFQYGAEKLTSDKPESTGSYALTLTPLDKWGQRTADGLTNIGLFLGINQALAGSLVLFVLAIMLAFYVYSKTQSGITVLLMVSATPFMGAYLGLMPMALAFVFVIVVITLMAYYFFSRGAL